MNKIELTKTVVNTIVGIGAARITKQIIANNTEMTSKTDKVTMTSASLVSGAMASKATAEYTDNVIDNLVDAWNKNKSTQS